MNPLTLMRVVLVPAMLGLVASARAQTAEIGAEVYLAQPGPITATMLAVPSTSDYGWSSALFYFAPVVGVGNEYATSLSTGNGTGIPPAVVGSTRVTEAIPAQSSPLFIGTFFQTPQTFPPGVQGDAIGTYVSTGLTAASNRPGGAINAAAAVIFGPNNTAQIGFAPPPPGSGFPGPASPKPASFTDYPVILGLTNVWDGHIAAIPEPSTWMLVLAGLLAGGVMWRRRMR